MTKILEFLEIASSFASLTPRNDRISAMTDEFRIFCDEIPQSSWGMTQSRSGDDIIGNSKIPYRDPPKGLGDGREF